MPEFLELLTPKEAMRRFLAAIPQPERAAVESVPTSQALGRVLRADVRAGHALPPFPRSTVDGYAVRAQDTYGASGSLPAYLKVIGEIPMGSPAETAVSQGEAVIVHTGGMIPEGADAVVMLEDTQRVDEREIEVLKPVSVGQSVLELGEDVEAGEVVVPAGKKLRAQELGGLMALGVTEVQVAAPPRVGILSTGDEVVPPQLEPAFGQIRDVNSYTLAAIVASRGKADLARNHLGPVRRSAARGPASPRPG
jgi:molybdopterin molybdotransferase